MVTVPGRESVELEEEVPADDSYSVLSSAGPYSVAETEMDTGSLNSPAVETGEIQCQYLVHWDDTCCCFCVGNGKNKYTRTRSCCAPAPATWCLHPFCQQILAHPLQK
jgi:hypothetical protein